MLAAAIVFSVGRPAHASETDESLADYTLASWSTKDGLPSNVIWAITQGPEGYLWLATEGGLVRFDGVRFVIWDSVGLVPLPKAPARSLHIARDSSLWVGFGGAGGVSRIHNGQLWNYGERDGIARGVVTSLAEDGQGVIHAGNNTGLYRFSGGRWDKVGPERGLPDSPVDSIYADRSGSFFVGTAAGISQRPAGSTRFQPIDAFDDFGRGFRGLSQDAAGRLWVTDSVVGFRKLGERKPPARGAQQGRGSRLLHDRHGNLWVATMGQGLWRVSGEAAASAPRIETARVLGTRSLFEDRDGNIWTGAGDGLIRLTKPQVTPVTNLGLVAGVEATPDGRVWVSTADELIRFSKVRGEWQSERQQLPHGDVKALHADEEGALWVATTSSLVRFVAGHPTTLPIPGNRPLHRINTIASEVGGDLWISDRDQGLFHWERGHPEGFHLVPGLGNIRVTSTYVDRSGRLWFSSTAGRLGVIDRDGKVQTFGPQDGLGAGPYNAIHEDRRHVLWVGGSEGLNRLVNGRFQRVNVASRFRNFVQAIVEDDDGDLWLGTGAGIAWVRRNELEKSATLPSAETQFTLYDGADGSAGLPVGFGSRSAIHARDGTLWFVTGRGLTIVDPRSLKTGRAPAKVKIEEANADDQTLSPAAEARLPPRTARLQIDYTALELTSPQKIRFRYRLEGFDADWIDAGSRRQALYTHLPPRKYRFHVVASHSDGSWNEPGAVWDFSIRPMFYQTSWFVALCVLALSLGTWAAWQLHVRHIRREFALVLGERVRLSREIHDTMLQSLVGVALQCDAVSNSLDTPSAARDQLVRIRKHVEDFIREARQSIWNLRSPALERSDLAAALRESGKRATDGRPVGFDLHVSGAPYRSAPGVEEQLLRIGQEAVLNAVQHAQADRVRVELEYGDESLVLRVSDNGHGFDPAFAADEPEGHYGLVSMKERAEQIGGRFNLATSADAGTVVETVVPLPPHG